MMKSLLDRLDAAFADIPGGLDELQDGASEDALAKLEATLDLRFPPDLRQFYLRHDGQDPGILFLFNSWRLWPVSQIESTAVAQGSERLYIGDDGGASTLAVERPGGADDAGGSIVALHEDGSEVLAPSFQVFIQQLVDGLESGTLIYDAEAGCVWSVEGAAQVANDLAIGRARGEAMQAAPSAQEVAKLSPGTEVELAGILTRTDRDQRHRLRIMDGGVSLTGSLGKLTHEDVYGTFFKVRVRIGPRRAWGLMASRHEILAFERM